MSLPNAHLALVERRKVVEYLLNAAHPDNGGKAEFFESLGFSIDDPERLVGALLAATDTGNVVRHSQSAHGEKYVVEGTISSQTETGHSRSIRMVWIINPGSEAPRLVTAYPAKE